MKHQSENQARTTLTWVVLSLILVIPIVAAAFSPQLQWREWVYILAGFAGIIGLCLLLVQPLLIGGCLPNFSPITERRLHRVIGIALFGAVIIHVAALWLTSPPDVIDALLLTSPTTFSIWGVIAMWAVFVTTIVASLKKRLRLKPKTWRICHTALAIVIIIGTVVHALLIEGTMEIISKAVLCLLVVLVGGWAIARSFLKSSRQ